LRLFVLIAASAVVPLSSVSVSVFCLCLLLATACVKYSAASPPAAASSRFLRTRQLRSARRALSPRDSSGVRLQDDLEAVSRLSSAASSRAWPVCSFRRAVETQAGAHDRLARRVRRRTRAAGSPRHLVARQRGRRGLPRSPRRASVPSVAHREPDAPSPVVHAQDPHPCWAYYLRARSPRACRGRARRGPSGRYAILFRQSQDASRPAYGGHSAQAVHEAASARIQREIHVKPFSALLLSAALAIGGVSCQQASPRRSTPRKSSSSASTGWTELTSNGWPKASCHSRLARRGFYGSRRAIRRSPDLVASFATAQRRQAQHLRFLVGTKT